LPRAGSRKPLWKLIAKLSHPCLSAAFIPGTILLTQAAMPQAQAKPEAKEAKSANAAAQAATPATEKKADPADKKADLMGGGLG